MARLFVRLKSWLGTQLSATQSIASSAEQTGATGQNVYKNVQNVVPYFEALLARSRT